MTFHKCKWMLKECFKYNIITNNSIIGHPVHVSLFFLVKQMYILYILYFYINYLISLSGSFVFLHFTQTRDFP